MTTLKAKTSKEKWIKEMKKKYPDRFPPMYWLFVDWGLLNKPKDTHDK